MCWNEHGHFLLVCHFLSHRFLFQTGKTLWHAWNITRPHKQYEKHKKKTGGRENKANLIREAFRCCKSFEVATKEQFDTPQGTSSAQGNPTRRTNLETPSNSINKTKNSIIYPRQMLSELAFRSQQDLRHKQNTQNNKCLCLTGPDRHHFYF